MKSTDMEDQGEIGCCKGWRSPWGLSLEGLVQAQTKHSCSNFLTRGRIPFQEKSRVMSSMSLVRPMWPDVRCSYLAFTTSR